MHSLEEKHGSKRREPKWHGIWHVHQAWAYKKMRRNIIPINFSLQFSKQITNHIIINIYCVTKVKRQKFNWDLGSMDTDYRYKYDPVSNF